MATKLTNDALELVPTSGNRNILGLTGPPAAGKTTMARSLVAGLNDRFGSQIASYVPLDGFHLSNHQLDRLNYASRKGAPFTFDVHGYVALLERILSDLSNPIYVPDYDRGLHEPIAARQVVPAETRLVITEGNYLACPADGWDQVADLVTQLWYIDTDDAVREERLIQRQRAGGLDESAARNWVSENDVPNGELIKRHRQHCTTVVASETRWD